MNKRNNIYSLILIAAFAVFFTNCQKDANNTENKSIVIQNTTVSNIIQIRATVKAKIVSNGGSAITEEGACFDTVPNPTVASKAMVADSVTADSFSVRIGDLKPNKLYYVRAYAKNSSGVGYGEEVTFTTHSIKVGDVFQGGTVFYLDASGLSGLIAAHQGLNYASTWGCSGISIPGTMVEIGNGKANTSAITQVCKKSGIAAQWSEQLVYNSFYDWYLPSKDELTEMYKHRDVVVMNNAERWSSSEVDANTAWALSFDAGGIPVPVMRPKTASLGVRPIRSFSY